MQLIPTIGPFLGVIPAIFCRERHVTVQADRGKQGFLANTLEFIKGIGITIRCSPFVKICAATFLVFNGYQLGMSFSLYVMIYYVFSGNDSQAGQLLGWFGTLTAAATLVVIPLTGWLATHIGKRRTFIITISVFFTNIYSFTLPYLFFLPFSFFFSFFFKITINIAINVSLYL